MTASFCETLAVAYIWLVYVSIGEIREEMCGFEAITQPPYPVPTVVNVPQQATVDDSMNQTNQVTNAGKCSSVFNHCL